MKRAENSIPKEFSPFFWDVKLEELDLQKHRHFVVTRLLNEGNLASLRWLFSTFSKEQIKEAVCESRNLNRKTAHCWRNVFDLSEEEMRCFGTQSDAIDDLF